MKGVECFLEPCGSDGLPWGSLRPPLGPFRHHFGPFGSLWAPSVPLLVPFGFPWGALGVPLGSHFVPFLGVSVFDIFLFKKNPKGHENVVFFGILFGSSFSYYFITFQRTPNNTILEYLIILSKVFDIPQLCPRAIAMVMTPRVCQA